jgi:hypothetical protein
MSDYRGALTPAALVAKFAEAGIVIPERTLRERARQLGAYRLIGKTMFLMPEDIELILDAAKPQQKRPAKKATGSNWTEKDTEALIERLTPKSKHTSARNLSSSKAEMSETSQAQGAFTPRSLSERWDCSERHVRNMLSAGQLPYSRLGGKLIRIAWKDVDHFERSGGSIDG